MARWKINASRELADPTAGGHDSDRAWVFDLEERESGAHNRMRVDLARGPAGANLPEESERAVETSGRSAVERFLDEEAPPRRIVIGTTGVFVPATDVPTE